VRVYQFRHIRADAQCSRGLAHTILDLKRGPLVLCIAAATLVGAGSAQAVGRAEVVVELDAPSVSTAVASSRALSAPAKRRRLDLGAPLGAGYVRTIAAQQRVVERRIEQTIRGARVRRRYQVVVNALAVTLPATQLQRLRRLDGVTRVYPTASYGVSLSQSPGAIKAPALWGPDLGTSGRGVKIAILDDGVDHRHPFFAPPAGLQAPPGFPKGDTSFTSSKVIVARAFPARSSRWRNAAVPLDAVHSQHGTHVAGIAAGAHATRASVGRGTLSGVAPQAYLGNYKVLTVPTRGHGLNGNSPEIVAGIEAAVRDGMDVINLSLGQPEIEPSRDIVARALDGAADAGVVPVVAAGNDYVEFGRGSVASPATSAKAITVAGVALTRPVPTIADFSAAGPTPLSLRLKPDVSAPGADIVSSVPPSAYASFSGTSMAAPHAAGAVALLRQRHPTWTVAQIKSALVLTGTPVRANAARPGETGVLRQGGGLIDLVRADQPLVFAEPAGVSIGQLRRGATRTQTIALTDAGGGAGVWSVAIDRDQTQPGVTIATASAVTVPGTLTIAVSVARGAPERELSGYILLTRDVEQRRIPYWLRTVAPRLRRHVTLPLARPGTYGGNTKGRRGLVKYYRYPDNPRGVGLNRVLRGPELVFRVRLRRPAANFGVALLSRARGVHVEPRVVYAGDENRLTGPVGLPVNVNPYTPRFQVFEPVAGALRPATGVYDVVFDSATRAGAGLFTFRFWVDDTVAPRLSLLTRNVGRRARILVAARDAGSGIDPRSISARIDGRPTRARYVRRAGVIVLTRNLRPGRHRLELTASDHQEAKNMENALRILPNTTRLRAAFVVR
jgi:subtilisin family serine protease